MITPEVLGKRLKFFRERAHMSQFELENKIGAANGMISRIESGKVNPNKETIQKISSILHFNRWEFDYIIGNTSEPTTQEETNAALKEVEHVLNDPHYLGYVGDDRWKFVAISKGFPKIFKATQKEVDTLIGMTIVEAIIDDKLSLRKYLDATAYEELLELQLRNYYIEAGFMFDDSTFQHTLEVIESDPLANKIWESFSLSKEVVNGFLPKESRIVNFKVGALTIPMKYSREPLLRYPRFEMVEYYPVNKFMKFVTKLLI
jgi:transcriptional regulator with XRE-family HTH domain